MELNDNRTEDGLFKVSQSKVKQWRNCRRQFFYAHVMKIQRRKTPRPLAFGSIVHKMKETQAKGKDPFEVLDEIPAPDLEAYENDPEHYGENFLDDIKIIYQSYNDFWKDEPLQYLIHDDRTAEFPFEVDLPKQGIQIKGTIDAVTRNRRMNWLTEHKNHKNIPNDDERWRSVQSVVYIKILQMLGWWKNIEGTCWDYIRTKAPGVPHINKDGSISKARIDTLPRVVQTHLAKYRKTPEYKSMIDAATLNMPSYFQRVYTPIKTQLVKQVWDDFLSTAKEMNNADITFPPVRTIGRHCSWCAFEPLCRASMTGGDEDFLIEHDYVPSTYGEINEEANND
jgi:PD-(D/E)XK nuclease superfamily